MMSLNKEEGGVQMRGARAVCSALAAVLRRVAAGEGGDPESRQPRPRARACMRAWNVVDTSALQDSPCAPLHVPSSERQTLPHAYMLGLNLRV